MARGAGGGSSDRQWVLVRERVWISLVSSELEARTKARGAVGDECVPVPLELAGTGVAVWLPELLLEEL